MKPKLCLGTAQFGMAYGITNGQGKLAIETVEEILTAAHQSGISFIDTAQAYGDSEKVLGKSMPTNHEFKIISKLSPQPSRSYVKVDIIHWEKDFQGSLERLGVESLDSFLLHQPADLAKPGGQHLLDWLISLRERKLTRRLGLSIYESSQLNNINLDFIDIVQVPLSVYDQRLLKSGTIDMLQRHGIAVHGRSSFLQGLLLTSTHAWPPWVSTESKNHHMNLEKLADKSNCSLLDIALDFASCQEKLEALIFGVCNLSELHSFLRVWNSRKSCNKTAWEDWALDDPQLLDPRQWPR